MGFQVRLLKRVKNWKLVALVDAVLNNERLPTVAAIVLVELAVIALEGALKNPREPTGAAADQVGANSSDPAKVSRVMSRVAVTDWRE